MADELLGQAEDVMKKEPGHQAAQHVATSLALMRQLLACDDHGATAKEALAAQALALANHVVGLFRNGEPQREALKIAERKCRDVLVWRCQLASQLTERFDGRQRRDCFLAKLHGAVVEARDTVSAWENGDLCFRAGLYLQAVAAGGHAGQLYVSQALHAHRAEVAKRFPGAFLSNCQRTAARRGRTRNQRGQRTRPETTPEDEADVSAMDESGSNQGPVKVPRSNRPLQGHGFREMLSDNDEAAVDWRWGTPEQSW